MPIKNQLKWAYLIALQADLTADVPAFNTMVADLIP